jgi:hypothetical protein
VNLDLVPLLAVAAGVSCYFAIGVAFRLSDRRVDRGHGNRRPGLGMGPCLRCGHERGLHEHYRRGRDCGICSCRRLR